MKGTIYLARGNVVVDRPEAELAEFGRRQTKVRNTYY
jgi:hypothetical protein